MRKLPYIIITSFIIMVALVSSGCGVFAEPPPPSVRSYLDVQVIQEPAGGQNVTSLSCTYKVTYTIDEVVQASEGLNPPNPIELRISWTNDKGGTYNKETKVFSLDATPGGTFTSTLSPSQPGQAFDKTFWLKLEWNDSAGGDTVTSSKAVCTVR